MNTATLTPQFPNHGDAYAALLWIPGFSGNRTAFCSGNAARMADGRDIYTETGTDERGCPLCAPFEDAVNPNCGTGYGILTVKRTLTEAELNDIGSAVAEAIGKPPGHYDRPIRALRTDLERLAALKLELGARGLL